MGHLQIPGDHKHLLGSPLQITLQMPFFVKKGIFGGFPERDFVRAGWLLCVIVGNGVRHLDSGSGVCIRVWFSFFPCKECAEWWAEEIQARNRSFGYEGSPLSATEE